MGMISLKSHMKFWMNYTEVYFLLFLIFFFKIFRFFQFLFSFLILNLLAKLKEHESFINGRTKETVDAKLNNDVDMMGGMISSILCYSFNFFYFYPSFIYSQSYSNQKYWKCFHLFRLFTDFSFFFFYTVEKFHSHF